MAGESMDLSQAHPAPKPESPEGPELRTLRNGAVYDMQKKRIVSSKGVTTKITAQNAVALQSRRQELKRAAIARGANAVAEQDSSVRGHYFSGDAAFLEALGEAMMMKALDVKDPKSVDAARFLVAETGHADSKNGDDVPTDSGAGILVQIRQYILQLSAPSDAQIHETIEGDLVE